MNGVREALKPLFIVASICGVQIFEYLVLFLNYIHFVLFWTYYCASFAGLWIFAELGWLYKAYIIQIAEGYTAIASVLISALTFMHKKKFQNCLERISLINTTLEEINIPNEYSNLRMSAWKMIGIWCLTVVYIIFVAAASIFHKYEKYTAVLVVLVAYYTTFINYFTSTIICILLRYIGSRFDWINKYIGERIKDGEYKTKLPDKCGMYDLWNPVVEKKQERDIWMIM